jgi:hypothetical protein
MAEGAFQNDISALPKLATGRYENLFKLYQTDNQQYFYNILNTVQMPDDVNPSLYYTIKVSQRMPWSMISFNEYETMDLWWLICIINKVNNPISFPDVGSELKIIRKEFLRYIFDEINLKLKLT